MTTLSLFGSSFRELKLVAQAVIVVLAVASVPAAGMARQAGTDTVSGVAKTAVDPCVLTADQRQELAAIRREVAALDRTPGRARIDGLAGRVDALSHGLAACMEPQIKRMVAQAGRTSVSGQAISELQAAALRLATGSGMSAEERSRRVADLVLSSQSLQPVASGASDVAARNREFEEQSAILNRKLDSEVGRALSDLEGTKRTLDRLRR